MVAIHEMAYIIGSVLFLVVYTFSVFVFFFSSRRRHTRFDCDWSSDVCSSDLPHSPRPGQERPRGDETPRANHEGTIRSEETQQLVEQEFRPERVAKGVEKGGQPGTELNHPGQGARLAAVLLRRARQPRLPGPGTPHQPHPISS